MPEDMTYPRGISENIFRAIRPASHAFSSGTDSRESNKPALHWAGLEVES